MPIKDCNGDVIGVAQVINKLGGEGQFTAQDEKIFAGYLQFCGIGLRNAQLYEKSQLEVKRNQVNPRAEMYSKSLPLDDERRTHLDVNDVNVFLGPAGSRKNDFRGAEHDRAHGSQDPHAYTVADSMPTCSGN